MKLSITMRKRSKESKKSKETVFNPHSQRSIKKRPLLIKLYSLIAVLVLTLAFIGILEYAQRSLPSSQKSHFNPLDHGTSSIRSTALRTQTASATKILQGREAYDTTESYFDKPSTSSTASSAFRFPKYKRTFSVPSNGTISTSTSTFSQSTPGSSFPDSTFPNSTDTSTSASSSSTDSLGSDLSGNGTSTSTNDTITGDPTDTPTDVFVPLVVTSTSSASICTATAVTTGCTCPFNSEASSCLCSVDNCATSCACVFEDQGDGNLTQSCVCPPDTCTTCECPYDSLGDTSFYSACGCPAFPDLEGCYCTWEAPDPEDISDASCANVRTCSCGTNVRAEQCAAANATTPVSICAAANISTSSTIAFGGPVSVSTNSSKTISTSISTSSQGQSIAALVINSIIASASVSLQAGAAQIPTSSSSRVSVSVPTILPASLSSRSVSIPNIFPESSSSRHSVSVPTIPTTPSSSSLAVSIPTILPAIISISAGRDAQGIPTIASITLPPASPPPTGVIFFVSNSLSTASNGNVSAVPVTFLQSKVNPSLSVVTGSFGKEYTVPTALLQTEARPTPSITPIATIKPTTGSDGKTTPISDPSNKTVLRWSQGKTFLGGYLPIVVAKFYQMGWAAMCQQSLDLSSYDSLLHHTSLFPIVTCSGNVASWILIPFASDVIFFDTNYGCDNPNPLTPANPCWPPRMTSNGWAIRLIQGFLSVTAVVSLALIVAWFRKPHGGSNEPTSIAAIAAIEGHPTVMRDFSVPADYTAVELKQTLKGRKYRLDEYVTDEGRTRYGLVPAYNDAELDEQRAESQQSLLSKFADSFGWREKLFYSDAIFFCYLIGLLAITITYLRDVEKSVFAKLFSGSTEGRIVFAIIAAIAGMKFSRIERDTQTLAPYMSLQHLNATPTPTILLRKRTLPLTSFLPMIRNRHFIPAAIAFIAITGEFLIVTLSGLPYRPGQLRSEFLFCGISSVAILLLMTAGVIAVNIWRYFLPKLPRKPDTVANVLSYVVGTKMCDDFDGLERASVSERDERIRKVGKRYGFGKKKVDGEIRWIVDEVIFENEVSRTNPSTRSR